MAKNFISATYKSKKVSLPDETVKFAQKKLFLGDYVWQKLTFKPWTKYFVSDKKFLSWTNLILSRTKHILSGQMAGAHVSIGVEKQMIPH